MKILMINKFLYPNGGSETYMFGLGQQLEKMGHEVQYFGMEHEGRCVGNRVGAYTSSMDFHGGSRLAKLTYPLKTIYSSEARQKLRLVLDDFRPDVIHLNNFNYQLTPSVLLEADKWRRESGQPCRILYTAHDHQLVCPDHLCYQGIEGHPCEECLGGHYVNCIKHRCIHGSRARSVIGCAEATFWKWKKVYRKLDVIVCCSAFLKKKLDTNPDLRGKTVALHNFISAKKAPDVEKQDYVFYFGRFSKEKGVETFAKACKALPDIPFVAAGSGPLDYTALPGTVLVEKGTASALHTELTLPQELEAPVEQGQTVGKAAVYQGESLLEEYEVRAAADAPRMTVRDAVGLLWQSLVGAS